MQDTRDRITPVAFAPAPILMNLPLARPWRRGGAMLCDLAVIALLTELDNIGLLLFLFALWLWHKSHAMELLNRFGDYKVWIIRIVSLVVVFSSIVMIYNKQNTVSVIDGRSPSSAAESVGVGEVVGAIGLIIQAQYCESTACLTPIVTNFIEFGFVLDSKFEQSAVTDFIDDSIEDKNFSAQDITELKQWSAQEYLRVKQSERGDISEKIEQRDAVNAADHLEEPSENNYSPMRWFIGLVEDLGLGFGFAAVYFSCFTAWFNGQTFGKMLFNIKVIQLNDTKISLWESFGRYGGYGAGFATGLLGFVQIYWDPNRQAIQDKISATVVIDVGLKNKETLQKNNELAAQAKSSQQLSEQ